MSDIRELQRRLGAVWSMNRPGGPPHVIVALPSFSLGESILSHYATRIPALEHRYLLASLMLPRYERCEMVFVCSETPSTEVLEYYAGLAPASRRTSCRERLRIVTVDDLGARSVAEKLLDRPEALRRLRAEIGGRPAFIEPWNVTDHEVEVATRLDTPINGTLPELWPLGYKGAGRRLFRQAGVPTPTGREDVRTVDQVCAAIAAIRAERPGSLGVVIKHDDSGAGDGNLVVELCDVTGRRLTDAEIRARVEAMPSWYRADLALGGVVEELITGAAASSPSVQLDISPYGDVTVLATHEQVLGGPTHQIYSGCRFPANPAYSPDLAAYALGIGRALAGLGVVGRLSADFVAVADAAGRWSLYALEINLRKGGTTHPYAALRHLVPGRYQPGLGLWRAADGTSRCYASTDNLVDPAWLGLPPIDVIHALTETGLQFDRRTGTGVVLHMLSCLAVDGRLGLTAIGRTSEHAQHLYDETARMIADLAQAYQPVYGSPTEPVRRKARR
ncbi:peptide ligase PGM1-related protein [Kribbella sp. NPDC023972]|uniref:peptide ligase PGM1-related protein n=1 Tax=Kribbella sp. NPDC023972 TaxID=3154795 RepID=UPI0033F08346